MRAPCDSFTQKNKNVIFLPKIDLYCSSNRIQDIIVNVCVPIETTTTSATVKYTIIVNNVIIK